MVHRSTSMKKSVREKIYQRLPSLEGKELQQTVTYLDRERQLLHAIFHLLSESILLVHQNGTIEFFNESASQLLGLPKSSLPSMPLWHWIPSLKHFFSSPADSSPDVLSKETALTYPEQRWVRIHVQPFSEKSESVRWIVLLQDITQERKASEEQRLQEQMDSVVQLSSEVAHELGNPLNSISIHLQLIQRTLSSLPTPLENTSRLLSSLSICQSEVQRLDGIVQHFLQSVRPRALELKRGSPLPTLQNVLSVLQPQLENAHIAVQWNIPHNLPTIFLDAARLHQAFFNLLKNAMEAIGTNGWIRISFLQDGQSLILAFADSGCGFSNEQATHVLSRHPHTQKPSGHGIGMLIVQQILREHNGSVEIESKKDVGSIIYLKFPLPEPHVCTLKTEKK